MKRLTLTLVLGVVLSLLSGNLFAQVTVQVIHNSPDPLADSVDIYLDGTLAIPDLKFREATEFLTIPVGTANIGVAQGNSSSAADTVKNFPVSLTDGTDYIIVANGLVDTVGYDQSLYGADIAFNLAITTGGLTSSASGTNDLLVFHGSTDAPSVDALPNGGAPLIDDLAFANFQGYAPVSSQEYVLGVTPFNDNNNVVASFYVDLAPLAGTPLVVVASGFLAPANNNNGPAFGLFAYPPTGGMAVPLTPVGTARAQVIHNSADPGADTVDIYINTLDDTLKLNDVAFRNASEFVSLPTGYELDVRIAGQNSTGYTDAEVATIGATLMDGESYGIIANGLIDTSGFAANPGGADASFGLFVTTGARETVGTAGNFELKVFHGSTDAPTVGVNANGGAVVPAASYGQFTDYLTVTPAPYRVDVTGANDPENVLLPFFVDASGFGDVPSIVFASGFLTPSANGGGPSFGLFAATPSGGEAIALTAVGEAEAQVIHNAADTTAKVVDIYINTLADTIKLNDFDFRDAIPFTALPSGYPLTIRVSLPTSANYSDGNIADFPATLADGEDYYVVANGLLDTMGYSVPAGRDADFTLLVDLARQGQVNGNSDSTDVKVLHGATDAPAVDVIINGNASAKLVENLDYANFTPYVTVQSTDYDLGVGANPVTAPGDVLATFDADLSGLGGGAGIVIASGFLAPENNKNGEAFGLWLFLPNTDGQGLPLPVVTNIDNLIVNNDALALAPNPAAQQVRVQYELANRADVAFRLYDMTGRVVWSNNLNKVAGAHDMTIDLNQIPAGSYTLVMGYDNRASYQRLQVLK